MPTINDFLYKGLDIGEISAALSREESPQMIYQITGSEKAAFAAQVSLLKQQALIITYTDEQAQK